jgi:hypothetical protein
LVKLITTYIEPIFLRRIEDAKDGRHLVFFAVAVLPGAGQGPDAVMVTTTAAAATAAATAAVTAGTPVVSVVIPIFIFAFIIFVVVIVFVVV